MMLRTYQPDDMDAATELFLQVFAAEPFGYTWLTKATLERYFTDLANTPGAMSFMYYEAEEPAGLCLGFVNDYFRAKLYDIKEYAVRKDLQGTGVGSRMLDEISAHLRKQDFHAITLSTQREIAAYGFYVKNGFIDSTSTATLSKSI
ncbi:MAG: GNAT family N-acetyltransferase [Defluviitaleaceae bacterium]|nr:GNAT family N-acetyltransferase [Defluviitaleaceae bacterium]